MPAILIKGYLPKEVTDSRHKSARVAMSYVREVVKKAGGKAEQMEVLMGEIYFRLKDEKGLAELKTELSSIQGVAVEQPTIAALIFKKEKARIETDLAKAEAITKK